MMSSTDKEASTRGHASQEFKMELAAHAHLRTMNLFSNPNNPFKVMQDYIFKMDQVVRRLSLNNGSILGNFKPVTSLAQCPLPLFIDPDGNLLGCFLHGTSEQGVEGISKTNFSESKSAKNGRLYGPGTYFTPTACKAFQYTGQGSSRELLLSAVFLGRPYYPSDTGGVPEDLLKDYDSVIALPRFAWAGRQAHFEIVVPNNSKEPRVFPLLNITAFDDVETKERQESVNMCHTM
jgi:hypothetical protein